MKLSIIVPVYNMEGEGKLAFCLDSLLNQTVKDYEIIAVDDKSTDDSLALLRTYENRYPDKVKVIASERNKKQGGAKNLGLKAAAGEFLGFIDSDDWITPDMYEKLINKAEETGADIVGCDYALTYEHSFRPGKHIPNNYPDQTGVLDEKKHRSLVMEPGSMVVKVYRREIFYENNLWFPEDIFYEDNCTGPLTMLCCKHFERIEEDMYFYYQHATSTVHYVDETKCRHRCQAALMCLEECRERGYLDLYREELEFRFFELYYKNTLFSYLQGSKKCRLSFIKELMNNLKKYVPAYMENPYYIERLDAEEKKLIFLHSKSTLLFWAYYRALHMYRKIRGIG